MSEDAGHLNLFDPTEAVIHYQAFGSSVILPQDPSLEELAFDWTLSEQDIELVLRHRGAENLCRFAIQLCVLRKHGRFLNHFRGVSPAILAYLCRQLDIRLVTRLSGVERQHTLSDYHREIAAHLGWSFYDDENAKTLHKWIFDQVADRLYLDDLIEAATSFLFQHKIILPGPTHFERIVNAAYRKAEFQVFRHIATQIPGSIKTSIDELLSETGDISTSTFHLFAEYPPEAKAKHILRFLERYEELNSIELDTLKFRGVGPVLLQRLASAAKAYDIWQLRRFDDAKRYALAACFLYDARQRLLDYLVEMHVQFMIEMVRLTRRRYEESHRTLRKQAQRGIASLRDLASTLIAVRDKNIEFLEEKSLHESSSLKDLFSVINMKGIAHAIEACDNFEHLEQFGFLEGLHRSYNNFRRYFRQFSRLPFKAESGNEYIIESLETLRKLDDGVLKNFPEEKLNVSFVPEAWLRQSFRLKKSTIDRKTWELSPALCLKDRLRSGDVYLPGSRDHSSFWNLCYDASSWEKQRKKAYKELGLPQEAKTAIESLVSSFEETAQQAAENLPQNTYATITNEGLKCKREDRILEPERSGVLRQYIRSNLSQIRIEKLLYEVDSKVHFSEKLIKATGKKRFSDDQSFYRVLMAALVAHGTNLGISTMAASTENISVDQLQNVSTNYLIEPALYAANTALVNYHHQIPASRYWGDGSKSSSDGQRFGVQKSSLIASFYPRYFGYYHRAISIYTHMSDKHSVFKTQVISCSEREAPYVLNGLLHNDTELTPKEHYTDTHGYTEQLFGLCHLLGYSFMPRIKNYKKQRFYFPKGCSPPPELEPLFHDDIDPELIVEQWDNLVRVAASLKHRLVSAHVIAKRLINSSPSNRLAKALTHLGRLVKTIYLLRYIDDAGLRRKILIQLNRGEQRHNLAKHVFFANQSEFTTGDYFKMVNKASCLSILSNAILIYNTLRIEEFLKEAKVKGEIFSPEEITRISPLPFRHVIVNGTYDFSEIMRVIH